ncbi:MAG: glycosyltransferase [Lachnospiraceae bacterium]|jgi:glycosyltransferase involved in cell wall biosynthesis|nr:glycosyltransferase [Lachnospiraceae bacterium]
MKISIIIPQFNENEDTIFALLSSINNQLAISNDIEVIVVNDNSNIFLTDTFLHSFPALRKNIKYIKRNQNGGPGLARNSGIAVASGDYIMFCDSDDVLHNVGVLEAFLIEIENSNSDMIISSWLQEVEKDKKKIYYQHLNEFTWLHGKMYKKRFLIDNDIKFDSDLRFHEDSYFNAIAVELAKTKAFLPATTYVWKWREDSITRINNKEYSINSYPIYISAIDKALDFLRKKELYENIPQRLTQTIIYSYFNFQHDEWTLDGNPSSLLLAEKAVSNLYNKWKDFYTMPSGCFDYLFSIEKDLSGIEAVKEPFEDFISRLHNQ